MNTYLVSLTPSEECSLWIVQTDDLPELVSALFSECGSHHRAQIFDLTLAEVQQNNCFRGKLLNEVVKVGDHSFSLHLQQLVRDSVRGLPPSQKMNLLETAHSVISREITLIKESIIPNVS